MVTEDQLAQWAAWIHDRDPYLLRQIRSVVKMHGVTEAALILRVPRDTLWRWWHEIQNADQ